MNRVIITGGSGLVGRALAASLGRDGVEVIVLSRTPRQVQDLPPGARAVGWDAESGDGWAEFAEDAAAIVNLAGASLAGEGFFPTRWTDQRKQLILDSRLQAGRAVVDAVRRAENKPHVVIQSSAIGYYGPRGDEPITEENKPGDDFLARVCVEWEKSTAAVEDAGVRRAVIRSGLILSTKEGSLPRVMLPYKLFVGGPFGNGQQYWSWIHLQDEVRAIRFLIDNARAKGPFNITGPHPQTNDAFGRTLGRILGRPHLIPVPGFAMRAAFGEVASVVLEGQRVLPQRLQEMGFEFEHPHLEEALRHVIRQDI